MVAGKVFINYARDMILAEKHSTIYIFRDIFELSK